MPTLFQARDHVGQHRVFTTVEMAGAGRIDDETVQIIGGGHRRISQRPDGETLERFRVGDHRGRCNRPNLNEFGAWLGGLAAAPAEAA